MADFIEHLERKLTDIDHGIQRTRNRFAPSAAAEKEKALAEMCKLRVRHDVLVERIEDTKKKGPDRCSAVRTSLQEEADGFTEALESGLTRLSSQGKAVIRFMDESSGNVVGLDVTGTLNEKDYALPKLEELFPRHGKLSVPVYADPEFRGWNLSAAWEDAAMGFRHAADFERLALVGAPDWVTTAFRLTAFLTKGEIKIFPADQIEDAQRRVKG